ncbi:uncharacterized protein [Littorina saxatilis]|uniref:uncharacterized protein n=1 Tax=Littorina saxatilis TaxID=31220 RepID=UPI0038B601A1
MAYRAQRKRRRRRDEESGGRRHQYDNEGLEPDEPDGRRHRDHEPYSRPRDEPEYPGAQVHRPTPREQNAHRYDDRNFRPDDREHPRRHHDDERRRPRHPDSDKRRPREDEPHFRPDGRPAHPRGYDDDDTQRHRYREDPAAYARGHGDTSRRPKHPDSAQETPGEDDAYVTLKDNSERPRRDRRDRNRLTQPDSDTHRYGAGDAHVTPDDHSPHSRRDHPHVHQPTQPYAGRQNFEKAAAAFGSGDPYADSRAKVHESRRKKPESQAKRGTGGGDVPYAYTPPVQPLGTSRHDRATVEEPLPFYSRPTGDEEQPNTPYKNDDDNDDEPSSDVTVDIEMVEMRHPRARQPITSPQQNGVRRYEKNPSAQSAYQPTVWVERATPTRAPTVRSVLKAGVSWTMRSVRSRKILTRLSLLSSV